MIEHVYVAVDNSPDSSSAIDLGVSLARALGARLTGVHAYAAKLHDNRFRQMEEGLPQRMQADHELGRQRRVHDSLIGKGLRLVADSYLDVMRRAAEAAAVPCELRAIEGPNYRVLRDDVAAVRPDLVVMGATGLGNVDGETLGSVCERVVHSAPCDVLVVRKGAAGAGVTVGLDGSPRSFGALQVARALAVQVERPLRAVAAYDPFFHRVAFESIAGVLSAEAEKVFDFRAQRQMHDRIIDRGLARVYERHLETAQRLARRLGGVVETELLEGKASAAILADLSRHPASLLCLGRTGLHSADGAGEVGATSLGLLRRASCNVLLAARAFDTTELAADLVWTPEARQAVAGHDAGRVEARVRQHGHTVVTADLVVAALQDGEASAR